MERSEFYQEHLDRVSRSFAFCIARLDLPLREYVGLGYLICRLIDTIEDAPWTSFADQETSFRHFDELLTTPSQAGCEEWALQLPKAIPESERRLAQDAFRILSDYSTLPEDVHSALEAPIRSMSQGMRFYMQRTDSEGELRLRDLSDVNRYCFYVAGVVGEMLTNLLKTQVPEARIDLVQAYRFGLFLQKVNLLKDQSGDEPEGRFLIPSRPMVRASVMADAREAFSYLLSIPHAAESFRLFCAWSLYLGLASLPWIDQADREKRSLKISRDETFELLAKVEQVILDDQALRQLFESLFESATAAPIEIVKSSSNDDVYAALYQGELSRQQMAEIFHY